MVDHARAARRTEQHRKIPDVPADDLELAAVLGREGEVGSGAAGEVVEDADATTGRRPRAGADTGTRRRVWWGRRGRSGGVCGRAPGPRGAARRDASR